MSPSQAVVQSFISLAVVVAGGLFLTVVLSGLLSALLTLGVMELFARRRIQRRVIHSVFRPDAFGAFRQDDFGNGFQKFIYQRYASLSPIIGSIEDYTITLKKMAKDTDSLVSSLTQLSSKTFYKLHYRQICGQLASVISREGVSSGREIHYTPLTDILSYLAEFEGSSGKNTMFKRLPQPSMPNAASKQTEPNQSSAISSRNIDRYHLELALRQVDVVQAELGNGINEAIYNNSIAIWTFIFLFCLAGSVVSFHVTAESGFFAASWETLKNILSLVIVVFVAYALAFGTAVFSCVAFQWLDRAFIEK